MRRLEVAFADDDQAILVEGKTVAAASWSYADGEVRLHAADGSTIARGVGGQLSSAVLPGLEKIKVFAVSEAGVQQVTTLPKLQPF